MRPPVVKRGTLPQGGFCPCFPWGFRRSAVRRWPRVRSALPAAGASRCLQHTRTVGLRDMGASLGALAQDVSPAPEELTGRAPPGGGDIGLRGPAPTPARRDVLGIDPAVCGVAAVDGVHGEGRSEDDGKTLPGTHVRQPGPREETCHAHDEVLRRRREGLEKRCGSCLQLAVRHALPVLLPETEGPWCGRAGRCHNTPRAALWRSACGLLRCFGGLCLPSVSRRCGMRRRGPQ
jgi:hypothetical protein